MVTHLGNASRIVNAAVNQINDEINKDNKERLNAKKEGNYVKRPIKSVQAELYFDNNEAIANVVEIKKEDIIKSNYIHIEQDQLDPDTIEFYENLINSNKKDLALIIADHTLHGAGCGEILVIDENTVHLDHIPQTLLEVALVKHKTDNVELEYPLVEVKDYNNKVIGYNKLFHYFYPEDFPETYKNLPLGFAFWYGGGQFNDFYDKPFYLQLTHDILSQMSIKTADTKTFNSGNQTSGIVYINKSGVQSIKANPAFSDLEYNPETLPDDDPDSVTSTNLPSNVETLKTEIQKVGFGNAFFYEETDDPMSIGYVNLTNNNQDYVIKKLASYKDEVYRRAKIPKERLMDSSVKESMNSQKTVAIWTIYLKSLDSAQQDFEQLLIDYIDFVYAVDLQVSIDIPEFEEFKIARAQLVMDLFNNAGLTHENYVKQLNSIYEWVDIDNLNEWCSKDYFYKGRLLSDLTGGGQQDFETMLGDAIAETKVTPRY
jgi:hypothetical protein